MQFFIGKHRVANGEPPLFLPDIGTFFNRDIELAKKMVDILFESGVQIIKGEVLHTADVCLKNSGDEVYLGRESGILVNEDYRALIERKVVSIESYTQLFTYCTSLGMELILSVYDRKGVDFAVSIGAVALKVASSNITHQPLIEYISHTKLPIIIDTGHSTLEEIARAVNWARDCGADDLIVEHSPLPPPNSLENHNLRFMQTLGGVFGAPYGLSDHHQSEEMLYAAAAMGAVVLEKGVCPDDMGDEQDGVVALPVSKVREVLKKINNISLALGDGTRNLRRDREKYRSRMCLVAMHDLLPGDIINDINITFAFPSRGIGSEYWDIVSGKQLKFSIKKGEPITWDHV